MENEKEVWERLTATEQSVKTAHHRIDNIEKLTESVYTLAHETKAMREDLNKVQQEVDGMKERPIKRYDLIVNTIITLVLGGVVGFVISRIF